MILLKLGRVFVQVVLQEVTVHYHLQVIGGDVSEGDLEGMEKEVKGSD